MATENDKNETQAENLIENGVHNYTDPAAYVWPKDAAVRAHLETYMDYKLGFMMHWAPGSQLGMMESWPLCDADGDWSQTEIDWTDDIEAAKQAYWDANKTFNPVKFRPDRWAKLAKECGFRYLLATTKHHDGFCMYDTKQTDYKITAPDCPFSRNERADIIKNLFDAFRAQGLAVSAYFSKPDWHSDVYWAKQFGAPADRNVNYNVKEHPQLWEQFVQYTHAQLREIVTHYGPVDMLWLDGGWVRPDYCGQDIRLAEIVEELRKTVNPALLVCDRTVGGAYENIVTPECTVPETILNVPWESCITLGDNFSFHYTDHYKTPCELVCLLVGIVAKGGNLALNITPQPDGDLPAEGIKALRGLGAWLRVNGEGIYGTRPCAWLPATKQLMFTQKANALYLFYLYGHINRLPRNVTLTLPQSRVLKSAVLLRTGETVPCSQSGADVTLHFDKLDVSAAEFADCVKLAYVE